MWARVAILERMIRVSTGKFCYVRAGILARVARVAGVFLRNDRVR